MITDEKAPRPVGRSVEEVAAMLGISRARVWQLETRAKEKMLKRLRKDPMLRQAFRDLYDEEPD